MIRLLIALMLLNVATGSIRDKLQHYEILQPQHLVSRERRSADSSMYSAPSGRHLQISAFNRSIECDLQERKELFSPKFRLTVVDSTGHARPFRMQRDHFFTGTVKGHPHSECSGFFLNETFTGRISWPGESFAVEPAWRHLNTTEHGVHQNSMIIYRSEDVIWPQGSGGAKSGSKGPTFCGADHSGVQGLVDQVIFAQHNHNHSHQQHGGNSRHKREQPQLNTCPVMAVADYRFYQSVGNFDLYQTASYMVGVIQRADSIFRGTNWGDGLSSMGLEIQQMVIHNAPTTGIGEHYNMPVTSWDPSNLLKVFSRNTQWSEYCIAHLFTHQTFANGLLGLAYIAPADTNSLGGICSPLGTLDGYQSSLNTGFSSTMNSNGDTVLSRQSELVTAHEMGHNWGSEHDVNGDECAPSSLLGDGKYLMYAYAVTGYDPNNDNFSPCSVRAISGVLRARASSCFSTPTDFSQEPFCGNSIWEDGEDCDAGYLGRFGLDTCCSSNCYLNEGATCSPAQAPCCVNCQMASAGTVCRRDGEASCTQPAYCSGTSLNCPAVTYKPDNTSCIDEGKCKNGVCQPFCEARGLISCVCDVFEESCQRCCRASAGSECRPYTPVSLLPDGRPCVAGYCESGSCKRTVTSTVQRLFDIIKRLDIAAIIIFFRNNLVGVIVVFSMLIWIPVSCCVSFKDRKRKEKFENRYHMEIRRDRELMFDEDGRKAERPKQVPRRPPPSLTPRSKTPPLKLKTPRTRSPNTSILQYS